MKLNIKKILARDTIAILTSSVICGIAFSYGYFLDEKRNERLSKYDIEIHNYISNFRKTPQVDSLYKLQMEFSRSYNGLTRSHQSNYFFWIDVRKAINDSTFNFTFASDEIINKIYIGDDYYRNYIFKIREILLNNYNKRTDSNQLYSLDENLLKSEFRNFAISNGYEKYLPNNYWADYQKLRHDEDELQRKYGNLQDRYLEYALLFCFASIFCLRYVFYILKWSITNMK